MGVIFDKYNPFHFNFPINCLLLIHWKYYFHFSCKPGYLKINFLHLLVYLYSRHLKLTQWTLEPNVL